MAKDKPHHEQSEQNPNDSVPSYGERCLHYKLLQVDEVESQSDLHSEAGQARAGCQEPGSENRDEYEKNDETSNRIEVGQKERYGEGGTVCPEVISQIAAVTTGRTNHRRACSSLPLLVSISLCAYIFFAATVFSDGGFTSEASSLLKLKSVAAVPVISRAPRLKVRSWIAH